MKKRENSRHSERRGFPWLRSRIDRGGKVLTKVTHEVSTKWLPTHEVTFLSPGIGCCLMITHFSDISLADHTNSNPLISTWTLPPHSLWSISSLTSERSTYDHSNSNPFSCYQHKRLKEKGRVQSEKWSDKKGLFLAYQQCPCTSVMFCRV